MKFLVLGASGMAGHVISIYLKARGHDITGFGRKKIDYVYSVSGDAKNLELIKEIVLEGHFDAVINAIGVLNQFAERDKEGAVFLNSYLPHFLAKITENAETQIIHMSTDCVFSGHSGPYTENACYDGQSFYDRSKALGELNDSKNITLRSSIVGPDMNEEGIGLLNWFMKQEEVNGYTRAMWTGLTTLEMAKVMEQVAKEKVSGLVNMVYEKNISKYELLKLFNRYICRDEKTIYEDSHISIDKTLIRTNFSLNYSVPDYEAMVCEMASWIREHKSLYPHYKL